MVPTFFLYHSEAAAALPLPVCSGVVLRTLFHPKQLMVISGGDDGEVRVWDLVTKSCAAGTAAMSVTAAYVHMNVQL
jgi:WD40 repeat protein